MTAVVISITVGILAIISTMIKGFNWLAKKIESDYQKSLDNTNSKHTIEEITRQLNANSVGTRAMLRFRLRSEMLVAIERGWKSIIEFEDMTTMFEAYKELDGNGTMDDIYRHYCALPIKDVNTLIECGC